MSAGRTGETVVPTTGPQASVAVEVSPLLEVPASGKPGSAALASLQKLGPLILFLVLLAGSVGCLAASRAWRAAAQDTDMNGDGSCGRRLGDVSADQICEDDPLVADLRRLQAEWCQRFRASDRFLRMPASVVNEAKCIVPAFATFDLPRWAVLEVQPCWGFTLYEPLKIGNTTFIDLRTEHVPHLLLLDNDPTTRVTLQNSEGKGFISGAGMGLSEAALFDINFHMKILAGLKRASQSRYFTYTVEHTVRFALDVYVWGDSGIAARMRALSFFSRGATYEEAIGNFSRCAGRGKASVGPSRTGLNYYASDEVVSQAKDAMPPAAFAAWHTMVKALVALS